MQFTFDQGLILLLLGVVLGKKIESKRIKRITDKAKDILQDEKGTEEKAE